MKKIISTLIISTLLYNLTACGTILYPERKGQQSGRIDVGIAVLDGIGLLFFLIPGVIAYAVDFSTGTIYLPSGKRHSSLEPSLNTNDMEAVYVGKENLSEENIKTVIYSHTGKMVDMHDPSIKVYTSTGSEANKGAASL